VRRWYNNDKKEDVFYLYNVFSRFHKFYKHVLDDAGTGTGISTGTGTGENRKLFLLLIELAKGGINNLTRTYNQTDKIHILHTLQMYKGMLDNPELVRRLGGGGGSTSSSSLATTTSVIDDHDDNDADDGETMPRQFPLKVRGGSAAASSSPPLRPLLTPATGAGASNVPIDNLVDNNIDGIFVKITDLYSQEDYTIIYHTLNKIQNDAQYYMNYIDGLNKILEPVNIRIKKWIDDNIVF
jgi:hypothetical protein